MVSVVVFGCRVWLECFFVFKQKTAYEVRISDWSSDVCSSDLVGNDLIGSAYGSAGERCMALPVAVPVGEETADRLIEMLIPRVQSLKAIGRTSCRERVC